MKEQVPVSERALLGRLNRHLLEYNDEFIRKNRPGSAAEEEFGKYYVVSKSTNSVTMKNIDVRKLAREEGVLKPYEK
jgi:hypothetical protein